MAIEPHSPAPTRAWGEIVIDLAAIALGAAIIWQTSQIRVTQAYAAVGPRTVPLLVGGGLVVLGLWLLYRTLTGQTETVGAESEDVDLSLPTDWRAVGLLVAALVVYLLALVPAGFVVASTILFAGAAYAMGSRVIWRDVLFGLILSLLLNLAFTAGLGIRLPTGPFAGFA